MFVKAYKYQCIDSLKSIVVYYIVMVVLYLTMIISALLPGGGTSHMSGMEIVTVIFLFAAACSITKGIRWALWYVILAALLLGICYLLIRRATAKKP